jgi:hypothetical protein
LTSIDEPETPPYCPLRELNLKSVYQKLIEQRTTRNVRREEEEPPTQQIITPMTTETYKKICETILAVIVTHDKTSKSDRLKDLVGYKILQHRAGKDYFQETTGIRRLSNEVKIAKKEWRNAVISANETERTKVGRKKGTVVVRSETINEQQNNNNINDNQLTPQQEQEETSTNDDEDQQEQEVTTNDVEQEQHEQVLASNVPTFRRYCALCDVSTANNPDGYTFSTIPIPGKKPTVSSSNKKRRSHAILTYRRKLYMERLKLHDKRGTKYLYICSKHEVQNEYCEVKYKDKINKEQIYKSYQTVPIDPNIQHRTRSNTFNSKPGTHRKRKKRNNNNDDDDDSETSNNQSPKRCRRQPRKGRVCNFCGCKSASATDPNVKFNRIHPPVPDYDINDRSIDNKARESMAINKKIRELCLRRMGLTIYDKRVDVRVCNKHSIEEVIMVIPCINQRNKSTTTKVRMHLPSSTGVALQPATTTKGIGFDRYRDRQISTLEDAVQRGDSEAEMRLTLMQMCNNMDDDTSTDGNGETDNQQRRLGIIEISRVLKVNKVVVRLDDLNDFIVHAQTGFVSKVAMLGYIAILCKGDINEITTSSTTLTWFEEYYLFFEVLYGRSLSRWVDAVIKYRVSDVTLRKIYDKIMKKALKARLEWPRYVSINEDETYRKENRWDAYIGQRVIMFDNTNIGIKQPSDAEAQRATYSVYYSGNVSKGAVHIQPCGWIGSNELWSGGVSDSYYMLHGEVFPTLNEYLRTSPLETEHTRDIKFTIILDRGYRVSLEAMNKGGHFVLQPIFALADRKFNSSEVLHTSTVSSDRAGNERAVKYLKISDFMSKGLLYNESAVRLCDTWLAWGFQVNFMYRPVH